MWIYYSYRAASTIASQTQSSSSQTTQLSSVVSSLIVNPVGPNDSYTRTDTSLITFIGQSYGSQSLENINLDVFAGTNSTGGSSFYASTKITQYASNSTGVTNNFQPGGTGGAGSSSATNGSTSITSSIADFVGTSITVTLSVANHMVDPTSYTTSFQFSTSPGNLVVTKLTLFRDGRPADGAQWSISITQTFISGQTYKIKGSFSTFSSKSSTTGIAQAQVAQSTYTLLTTTAPSTSISGSGTFTSADGISSLVTSKTYNSTTVTETTTASNFTTTTSTRVSTYPGPNGGGGTLVSSSVDTFATLTQILSTITHTTYQTASTQLGGIQDSIHVIESSEWAWNITTTGSRAIELIGDSYTGTTTLSATGIGSTVSEVGFSGANGSSFSTQTFTSTSFISTTTASTRTTTSSSSYITAQPTSVADVIPFSIATKTVTVTFITTRATTYNYSSATTTTTLGQQMALSADSIWTSTSTVTQSITTTFSGGTSISLFTQTIPSPYSNYLKDNHTSSTSSSTQTLGTLTATSRMTASTNATTTASFIQASPRVNAFLLYRQNTSTTSPLPTYSDITAQPGFQALSSLGSAYPFGTNLAVSPSLPMRYPCASIYPGGPVTPMLSPNSAETFAGTTTLVSGGVAYTAAGTVTTTTPPGTTYVWGAVAINPAAASSMTLVNTLSATQLGGFGWDSTRGTTISGTSGVHRVTLFNATSWTVTELIWTSITSFSIPAGVGFVAESRPQAFSASSSLPVPSRNLLTFSAFPSS